MFENKVSTCWCYTTNEAYLLPTLVSAVQLSKSSTATNNSIRIICFGNKTDVVVKAAETAFIFGIILVSVPLGILGTLPMTCARFFLNNFVSDEFNHIVYLDGDTQIVGDVRALAVVEPVSGSILAAPDIMSMTINQPNRASRKLRAYFLQIGLSIDRQAEYFNAGVIKAGSSDWATISNECLKFFKHDSSYLKFRFLDQDVLNLVLNGAQTKISLAWNFPGFALNRGLEQIVKPKIIHYMSRPRPWDGPFSPWGQAGYAPYVSFMIEYPFLSELYRPFTRPVYARYVIQQQAKRFIERWGSRFMLDQLRSAEQTSVV